MSNNEGEITVKGFSEANVGDYLKKGQNGIEWGAGGGGAGDVNYKGVGYFSYNTYELIYEDSEEGEDPGDPIGAKIYYDLVDENNLCDMFSKPFDFVIDAIDQVKIKAVMADYFIQHNQAFIVSGGAGGQRLPEKIRYADLSLVRNDKLLANMRYTLRKKYALPREGKMGVPCVYSEEQIIPPQTACNTDFQGGLSCAGFGAVMTVTATFGLFLANRALEHIAKQ